MNYYEINTVDHAAQLRQQKIPSFSEQALCMLLIIISSQRQCLSQAVTCFKLLYTWTHFECIFLLSGFLLTYYHLSLYKMYKVLCHGVLRLHYSVVQKATLFCHSMVAIFIFLILKVTLLWIFLCSMFGTWLCAFLSGSYYMQSCEIDTS